MIPNVLAIAGHDPSGGAGVLADVKTISAWGCYGMAAITAITVQNTLGVSAVRPLSADVVAAQLAALFDDIRVDAVKIGMLGDAAVVRAVGDILRIRQPAFVVLDPVLASTSGAALATDEARRAMCDILLPLATVTTPNLDEARILSGASVALSSEEQVDEAAARLLELGARTVLIKGGHGSGPLARDALFSAQGRRIYSVPRISTRNTHGTGCALSSAIACALALGVPLGDAVARAKAWLTEALRSADRLSVGRGHGPIDHFWRFETGRKAPG